MYRCLCGRVPADLKTLVYHFGVVTGGEKEWDFVYSQFKSTDVVSDKSILLYAMAGSQEPWIIERYLHVQIKYTVQYIYVLFCFVVVSILLLSGRQLWYSYMGRSLSLLSDC